MKWFFDMDNPVMRTLSRAADLIVLNLLALLCSLPIVTAGAALTALFDQAIRLVRGEDYGVAKGFLRAFRLNFKTATLLWLLFLAAGLVIGLDYAAALTYVPVMRTAILALSLLLLAVLLYAFGLLARYENTVRGTLKNAVSLAVAYFPRTLGMLLFTVGLWLVCVFFFRIGTPILLMFGLSLPAYFCALLLSGVFQRLENNSAKGDQT